MLKILNIVLPVFFVIGVGYFLKAKKFVTPQDSSKYSWFVFYVSVPALLFRSAAKIPANQALDWEVLGVIYFVTILLSVLVFSLSFFVQSDKRGVIAQGAFRSNMVFVGLPIINSALGNSVEITGRVSLLISLTVPLYNVLAIWVLSVSGKKDAIKKPNIPKAMKSILYNPIILSSMSGLLFSFLNFELPLSVDRTLELLGRIAAPLALVTVGISLDFPNLKNELGNSLIVSFLKLMVCPGLIYFLLSWMEKTDLNIKSVVLLMATPTAVVSHIMSKELGGNEKLSAAIVAGTTTLSLFSIVFWLFILG